MATASKDETKQAAAPKGKPRRVPNMGRIQVEVENVYIGMSNRFIPKDKMHGVRGALEDYQTLATGDDSIVAENKVLEAADAPRVPSLIHVWVPAVKQPDHKDTAAAWAWVKEQKITGRVRVVAVKAVHLIEQIQTVETKVTVES